jgi:hypothetical protein
MEHSVPRREWGLQDDERDIVGQTLTLHDVQLAVVPARRYWRAWEQVQALLKSDRTSVVDG